MKDQVRKRCRRTVHTSADLFFVGSGQLGEVLILSEFTGAFQSLGAGAVRVNPWNIEETAEARRLAALATME